jgi:hypothetical protein
MENLLTLLIAVSIGLLETLGVLLGERKDSSDYAWMEQAQDQHQRELV